MVIESQTNVYVILAVITEVSQKSAHPLYTFDPFSCTGQQFTRMITRPGASFAWNLRTTALSAMHI